MKANAFRWALLVMALLLAVISLFTTFKAPVRVDWRLRMVVGMAVGEFGRGLGLLPLCIGMTAWFFRRGHPGVTAGTIGFCAVAILLMFKPAAQAWRLGRELPAQLTAAFGPAAPERVPYSAFSSFARASEAVEIETKEYSGSLQLDFYRAVGRLPAPCVVAIHGGAWCMGDRKESLAVRQSNDWLARHGYAVASIDYRLAPAAIWPAQRDDVLAALAYLRAHAELLGIDAMKFVLMGRSAGGQLAEVVGYSAHDPGIRGVIALYAPADLAASFDSTSEHDSFQQRQILQQFLGGTPATARAAYDSASGALLAGPDAPPTLLLHGGLDTIVPHDQSELMAGKLAAAGVPHTLISLAWGTHGFDYASFNSPGAQITTYAIEWFLYAETR
jgi:acetyl esterase/lipase